MTKSFQLIRSRTSVAGPESRESFAVDFRILFQNVLQASHEILERT